jgi:hypothetical protein
MTCLLGKSKEKEKTLNSVPILILCAILQLHHKRRRYFKFLTMIVTEAGKISNLFLQKKLFIQLFIALFKAIFQKQGRTEMLKAGGASMNYSLNFHDYLKKISKAGGAFHSKSQQIFRSRGGRRAPRAPLGTPLFKRID